MQLQHSFEHRIAGLVKCQRVAALTWALAVRLARMQMVVAQRVRARMLEVSCCTIF